MSESLNRLTYLDSQLLSKNLAQIVSALSEIKQEIIITESKTFLTSIVSKTANRFESTKNIIKYQYLEFLRILSPLFDLLQNKKEILDVTSRLLTSNDYISRIISLQIIILFKNYIDDRVDIFHNLINAAMTTQSSLELNYLFKAFVSLTKGSEAFAFSLLQQMKKIHLKFSRKMHIKKLLGLIQAAASRISKDSYIEVLIQTMKENLEGEFDKILEGANDLSLTISIIIIIGNLILNSFSSSSELIQLVLDIYAFLIAKSPPTLSQDQIYACCKLIINLLKRLFLLFPSLKTNLNLELNQMMNRIIGVKNMKKVLVDKIFMEIISMLGSDAPLESLTIFFPKLQTELKIDHLLRNGNLFQFDSGKIKSLFCQEFDYLVYNNRMTLTKNYFSTINLFTSLKTDDLLGLFSFSLEKLNEYADPDYCDGILNLILDCVLSIQKANLDLDNQREVLKAFKIFIMDLNEQSFIRHFKPSFSILVEVTKIQNYDSRDIEAKILEIIQIDQRTLSLDILYWMMRKSIINNCFHIGSKIAEILSSRIIDQKNNTWIKVCQMICDSVLDASSKNFNLEYLMNLSKLKSIIYEKSFTYEFLKYFNFLIIDCREMKNFAEKNIGDPKVILKGFYDDLSKMRFLEGSYFIDENSFKSLNILIHCFEIVLINFESLVRANTSEGLNKTKLVLKKIDKLIISNPLHDGEIKLAFYLKHLIDNYDISTFLTKILLDFINYKFTIVPRLFFRFPKKIDLNIRLVNHEDFIDKNTGHIKASNHLGYVMDLRIDLKNLPREIKSAITLNVEAHTKLHHNWGSESDITTQISNLTQSFPIEEKIAAKEVSFVLEFPTIGRCTTTINCVILNKNLKIVIDKRETYIIDVY